MDIKKKETIQYPLLISHPPDGTGEDGFDNNHIIN
jgi:hypothetical protein